MIHNLKSFGIFGQDLDEARGKIQAVRNALRAAWDAQKLANGELVFIVEFGEHPSELTT